METKVLLINMTWGLGDAQQFGSGSPLGFSAQWYLTCGISKLMPLMVGYLLTIVFRMLPSPPPTSTMDFRPSNPLCHRVESLDLFSMISRVHDRARENGIVSQKAKHTV